MYYFDKRLKVKYFIGDLVRFNAPFFTDIFRVGIVVKVIEDEKEVFKNIVLEVYGLDGSFNYSIMPFLDDIELLSRAIKENE